ncbi:uncharacterized protein BKCO1_9000119 [Diplodia corticola]|uniref:Uncharacterized protein n=1 Tax=Diplodia corticola TaxID=236234 RepID=A0A1J9S8M7_9PEZI|nr:uncharacterized protein BKCO1_9000119 [Diplodia corticola]OJD36863.1 hypothetical protein BKCO1_9000119 [Diplodia corticola]
MHFAALAVFGALLATTDAAPPGNSSLQPVPAPLEAGLCNVPEMTPDIFQAKSKEIDTWLRARMQAFRATPDNDMAPSFFSYVLRTNFPNLALSATACSVDQGCSSITCTEFRGRLQGETPEQYEHERTMAVYATNAFSNFYNFQRTMVRAFENGAQYINNMLADLVHTFSWTDNQDMYVKQEKARKDEAVKRRSVALSIGLLIILVAAAAAGPYAVPIYGEVTGALVGAAIGALSSAYAGGTSIAGNFKPGDVDATLFARRELEFSRVWTTAAEEAKKFLKDTTFSTVKGRKDNADGRNIIDALMYFHAPFRDDTDAQIEKEVSTQLVGHAIDLLWSEPTTNAWIVRSKAPTGASCVTDSRINEAAKVCLPEEPDITYFVTGTDNFEDKETYLHVLPGFQTLRTHPEKWRNITVEDVVRSSVRYYKETRNRDILEGRTGHTNQTDVETMLERVSKMGVSSIHLPVCNSLGGQALGALNQKRGMVYPCVCEDINGAPETPSPKSETLGLLKQSGLITRPHVYRHCRKAMQCAKVSGNPYGLKCTSDEKIKGKPIISGWCKNVFSSFGPPASGKKLPGSSRAWLDEEGGPR